MDEAWTTILSQLKDSPIVLVCLAWIASQQWFIKYLLKRNAELEALIRLNNDKFRDDIAPLMTRLMDLIPDLIAQVRRRK